MSRKEAADAYIPSEKAPFRGIISPRVILLDPSGRRTILVRYQDTNWWGLPGGKIKANETEGNVNLVAQGAFPTLRREVLEEVGIDIGPRLLKFSACLGVVEVFAVDSDKCQLTRYTNPIFICKIPYFSGINPDTTLVTSIDFPGPLFPDARVALHYLKESLKTGKQGPILPEFLGKETVWFQMKPAPQPLFGRPAWLTFF